MTHDADLVQALRRLARPVGDGGTEDALLEAIGGAGLVLIGEASHGTHDFYRMRADLTKRLIAERGFGAVAVEGDWPDAWRVNQFVRGRGPETDPEEALGSFRRFPTWMWRNTDVLEFVGWLRRHNQDHPDAGAGFYGIDLYSLHASIRPSLPGSFERLFHDVGIPRFLLLTRDAPRELDQPRLQRAIGVIYRPRTERQSHYFHARVRSQFDAVIHLDETRALEPLDRGPQWDPHEPPETFPSGI